MSYSKNIFNGTVTIFQIYTDFSENWTIQNWLCWLVLMDMLYVFLCTWPTLTVTVCSLKSWTGWQTCRFILSPPAHFLICARPHTLQIYISHTFHQPPALSQLQKMFRLTLTCPSRVSQTFILFSTYFFCYWTGDFSVSLLYHELFTCHMLVS